MDDRLNKRIAVLSREVADVRIYAETDSTNSEAKRYAVSGGRAPALFLADRQTAGRGRLGRSFYSPEGSGLYMSLLLPTKPELADTVLMTSAAAVAVRRAILSVTGKDTGIKWVNDLYLNGRKVCGILCELLSSERMMIVGVGINLSNGDFPEEIAHVAGSLGVSDPNGELRDTLAARCAKELLEIWETLGDGGFMDEYRKNSIVLGDEIIYTENGVSRSGLAVDIDSRGRLTVKDSDGITHLLSSGEISVRPSKPQSNDTSSNERN